LKLFPASNKKDPLNIGTGIQFSIFNQF